MLMKWLIKFLGLARYNLTDQEIMRDDLIQLLWSQEKETLLYLGERVAFA